MHPSYGSDARLLTRHYRVVLECRVAIHPIKPSNGNAPSSVFTLSDQQVLQAALLANPDALDGWLQSRVWVHIEYAEFGRAKVTGDPFLLSVLGGLPVPLADRYRAKIGDGSFYLEADEFLDSFQEELRFVGIGNDISLDPAASVASAEHTRRYMIELGYEITVKDFTPAEVEVRYADTARRWAHLNPDSASLGFRPIPSPKEVEDQRALLRKLLESPEVLESWLLNLIMADLEARDAMEGAKAMSDDEEDRMLIPVIEALPPRPRHHFREALASDQLMESAEEFWDSFDIQVRSIELSRID